jgi:hypothetical protein
MPDVHDLLRVGAGERSAALDIDVVMARGTQYRRNRQRVVGGVTFALCALVVTPALFALRAERKPEPVAGTPSVVVLPTTPAASAATLPTPGVSQPPVPATSGSPSPSAADILPDGVHYARIVSVDAQGRVTFNKVDRRPSNSACINAGETDGYDGFFRACWSDTNPKLRTMATTTDVEIAMPREGDPIEVMTVRLLREYVSTARTDDYLKYLVISLYVLRGKITRILPDGCSATDGCIRWAEDRFTPGRTGGS